MNTLANIRQALTLAQELTETLSEVAAQDETSASLDQCHEDAQAIMARIAAILHREEAARLEQLQHPYYEIHR